MTSDCLFCKIINKEIPSNKIYEDDFVYAFLDISPVNKGHVLIIPKKHSTDILDMEDSDISKCFTIAKRIGNKIMDFAQGFNINMNTKPASGQVIFHSHIHIIPRFNNDGLKLWPGKLYNQGEAEKYLEMLKL